MFKIIPFLSILSVTILNAQDLSQARISNPIVPTKVSNTLFGGAEAETEEKTEVTASKSETTENKTETAPDEDPVKVTLPALSPLPDQASDPSDPLTLLNQLSLLPSASLPSESFKKKVNGKWVITTKRTSTTQFEVREVNGRKVICPK